MPHALRDVSPTRPSTARLNGTTGKPQPGSTVTLFQTTHQGPQNLGSVKTDAAGKFVFTQDVQAGVGGGPLLLQAVYDGRPVQQDLTPGSPIPASTFPSTNRSKSPGGAKIDQHFFVLEPSPDGNMQVSEGFVYKNDGKTTWNDPDRGTLEFDLPAAAQGKVEVNVVRPAVCPSGAPPIRWESRTSSNSISPSSLVNRASNSSGPCHSRVPASSKIAFFPRPM